MKTSKQRPTRPTRATAYDKGQHELICTALDVSPDPNAPGDTAYEAVCELLYKADLARQAKTLEEALAILNFKPGTMMLIPLYGTGTKKPKLTKKAKKAKKAKK